MQPNLLDLPEPRAKKRGRVTRTSVAAYRERPRDGRIAEVLEWLAGATQFGEPVTSAELTVRAGMPAATDCLLYVRRGLSDAKEQGLVEHAGTRRCAVSGRTCCLWRVVSR